ncbi:hypothetical protein ACFLW2_03495 [Chloroflexota bacterium]
MADIGVVRYQIINESEIHAVWWNFVLDGSQLNRRHWGTGIARGDTSKGFPGEYKVTYTNHDGTVAGPFDLKLVRNDDVYELYWTLEGQLLWIGTGMETPEGLYAGWREAQ